MKTIKLQDGTQLGLFLASDVVTTEDRYVINGAEYPFSVLGEHLITDYVQDDVVTADDKLAKLQEVNRIADAKISVAVASYPEREIDTFSKQLAEATAYLANPMASVPMISAIAALRGVTVAYLADRIIINSNNFSAYCGAIIGYRQKLEGQINAATKMSELQAVNIVDWPV